MTQATIKRVSEFSGVTIRQIQLGMKKAETEDPLLGACYFHASTLAVNVKGDRHGWNLKRARTMYDNQLGNPQP